MTDVQQLAARAPRVDDRIGIAAVLDGEARPVDASVIALAVAILRGQRRPAQLATDDEARRLARAVLSLSQALAAASLTDRTAAYAVDEPDRTGAKPPAGDAWSTPREIAEGTLPCLVETPSKGPSNGQ